MRSTKVAVATFLLVLWAVLPWPLLRAASALFALFVLFSGLWSVLLARGLASSATDPLLRAFSGRRLLVSTRLENRSPLPSGLLFVFDSSGGLETWGETRHFLQISPFHRMRFEFEVRGRERGQRELGPLRVSGADPAGLFPFTLRALARELIVYPPLRSVEGWPRDGLPPGARRWEPSLIDDSSRFRSYREFQPGDALARLSAAAWAQRGHPQVRTFDRTVSRPTGVVVDLRASLYPLKLRWALVEAAVQTAASLVWDSLGRGETVWLTVIDADREAPTLGPGRGWSQARGFLERLALAVPDKNPEPSAWPEGLILPPAPLRLLWVSPARQSLPSVPMRGYEVVHFAIEEGRAHGQVVHP